MFQQPELLLGEELKDLLYTDKDCTPIRNTLLHKKFRRDESLEKVPCPSCNLGVSGSKEGQVGCPYCKGDGFLWDEFIVSGWFFKPNIRTAISSYILPSEAGRDLNKEVKLLTPPEVFIAEGDIVYDIKINDTKRIHIPIIRYENYLCYFAERYSSNQSDSEFNIAGLRV